MAAVMTVCACATEMMRGAAGAAAAAAGGGGGGACFGLPGGGTGAASSRTGVMLPTVGMVGRGALPSAVLMLMSFGAAGAALDMAGEAKTRARRGSKAMMRLTVGIL